MFLWLIEFRIFSQSVQNYQDIKKKNSYRSVSSLEIFFTEKLTYKIVVKLKVIATSVSAVLKYPVYDAILMKCNGTRRTWHMEVENLDSVHKTDRKDDRYIVISTMYMTQLISHAKVHAPRFSTNAIWCRTYYRHCDIVDEYLTLINSLIALRSVAKKPLISLYFLWYIDIDNARW